VDQKYAFSDVRTNLETETFKYSEETNWSNRNTNYTSNYTSDDRSSQDNLSSAKRTLEIHSDQNIPFNLQCYEVKRKDEYDVLRERVEKSHKELRQFRLDRHSEVKNWKRAILIDWLQEVSSEYKCQRRTNNLATTITDLYLSKHTNICENELQLLAVASLYIASKYEEV